MLLILGSARSATPAEPRASPTLPELVQVADISGLAASPDGQLVAFRTDRPSIDRNSYDLAWHILDFATGRIVEVAGGGEPIIEDPGRLVAEAPVWSEDSRWIYYRALRGNEVQVWRAAADGSSTQIVTAEDGDVLSLDLMADRKGLLYRVGPPRDAIARAETAEYDAGILVDAHVELGQNLFRGAIINGRRATERLTGRWFSRGGILWDRPVRVRRLHFSSVSPSEEAAGEPAKEPPAMGSPPPDLSARSLRGDVATARWTGTESEVAVTRSTRPDRTVPCSAAQCHKQRVRWISWRPGADQLLFATSDPGHAQTLRLWDLGSGRVRALAPGRGLLSGGRDAEAPCAVGRRIAACVAAAPGDPPRLMLVDLQSGAMRTAFDPNLLLRERRWPSTERLEWRGRSGRLFTGTLFLPMGSAAKAGPLFINYYQCDGYIRGGVGDEWPFTAFAAAGIASVCISATPSETAEDGVGRYRAASEGIEALVDGLVRRGLADRRRIGMGGLSFGSEATMWMVMHSELIAAASVASPQFEPSNYWFNAVRGRDHHQVMRRFWGLGKPEETPEQWRLLSPALNVDRIRAPLLLQLPEQEARYAVELYARLTNSSTPTELYVFPDERHIKMQPRHRLAVYRRNLDWFRFWLQNHIDPDPTRAAQFQRWRELASRARQ
jgi:dienelactone hydrolase